MKSAPIPDNDQERLRVLDALDLVYSPAEERFDRITRVARRLFDVPIVLISLVTRDKQWFKSCQGLDVKETGREISFCGHAIIQDDTFVVPNAAKDPDFSDNPLVTGEPRIRFYAGQPLIIDAHRIGTLCLIDRHPRHLKPRDYDSLRCLATWVETEIVAWKVGKNRFVEQALGLPDREQMIDSLTGDLRSNLLGVLLSRLAKLDDSEAKHREVFITLTQLDAYPDKKSREQSIVATSQALHRIIGDEGLVAFDSESEFSLLLSSSFDSSSEALSAALRLELQVDQDASEKISFVIREAS